MENVLRNENVNKGIQCLDFTKLDTEKLKRESNYLEFLRYMNNADGWDYTINIIDEEEYRRFYASDLDDDEMDMKCTSVKDFCKKGFGMSSREFANSFVSMEFEIPNDEYMRKINVVINREVKVFIIDAM